MKTSIRIHEGRVASVTGPAKASGKRSLGIGRARSASDCDRPRAPEETSHKIGRKVHAFQLDVTRGRRIGD
jgi:hypothetical protein